jgi:hypothetical protein
MIKSKVGADTGMGECYCCIDFFKLETNVPLLSMILNYQNEIDRVEQFIFLKMVYVVVKTKFLNKVDFFFLIYDENKNYFLLKTSKP